MNHTLTFETSATPRIHLTNIGGDLRIIGWEQNQILAQGQQLQHTQEGDTFTLQAGGNCTLRVPQQAVLQVGQVGGDLKAKVLAGDLQLAMVGGDAILRQVGAVVADLVSGDLSIKKANGSVRVQMASADVAVREVTGDVLVTQAAGDVAVREVTGHVRINALGDAILSINFMPNQDYAIQANGDAVLRVRPDASARFIIQSSEVSVKAAGAQVEKQGRQHTVTLGSGAATVNVTAHGDVVVTNAVEPAETGAEEWGFDDGFLAQVEAQVEAQIETQMADLEQRLNQHFASLNLDSSRAEAIAARARAAADRAQEKLRRKTEAIQQKLERQRKQAETQRQRETERSKRFAWMFQTGGQPGPRSPMPPVPPTPPVPPVPPTAPVAEEERLAILRMLEQGKINVADAEKLLAALEGK